MNLPKKLHKTENISNNKAREIYQNLGKILKVYTSGKLPKALTVLSSQKVKDWLQLLYVSEPHSWSSNALFAITTLFTQTASDSKCKKFFTYILLDILQYHLENSHKLSAKVWQALLKSGRRPKPYIFGILIPIVEQNNFSKKEAKIFTQVIVRVKLPLEYSNAFLFKICSNPEISVSKTIVISKFIEKRQGLAIKIIDAIFAYFMGYLAIKEQQPIFWHQTLLKFVKNYGENINFEQREAFDQLLKFHKHPQITKEIYQILQKVPPREDVVEEQFIPIFE